MSKPTNGTGVPANRKYPAITRRVNKLGELNDRLGAARNTRNWQELEKIADEYEEIGCKQKATEIRLDMWGVRKRKRRSTGYASGTKRAGAQQ